MNIYEQIVNLINEKFIPEKPGQPGTISRLKTAKKKMGRKAAKEFAMAKEAEGTNRVGNKPQAVAHHTRRGLEAIRAGQTAKAKGKAALISKAYSEKKVSDSIQTIGDLITEVAAWQRKEGKNPSGGLNKKGVASYRKENPGSKLKTAVTTKPSKLKKGSKAAKRRKSFCARMGGMKKRRTSTKTAKNPNSRINKALRKWNC
jgi:hypothetical protein